MKRQLFTFLIALAIMAILMDATYILYERYRPLDHGGGIIEEEEAVLTPDEVNLTLNVSSKGLTNYSNDFWVEGAPEGSNVTWLLNDVIIGYTEEIRYHFLDAGIFKLEVRVRWDKYSESMSHNLSIERVNNRGSMQIIYPWYWNIDIDPYQEIITMITPGIIEPTCWINISFIISKSLVKCWLELREEDKMESFEIINYDVIPLGQNQYTRTLFFDKDFFAERETREDYFFMIRLEFSNPDSGSLEGEVSYEITYS